VRGDDWIVPVMPCSAAENRGIDRLLEAVRAHRAHLEAGDLAGTRRAKRLEQVKRFVGERLEEELWSPNGYADEVESALRGSVTPYDVGGRVLASILGGASRAGGRGAQAESARS